MEFSGMFWSSTLKMLEGLDHPRALAVAILARHGEWDQLVNLRVDPQHHNSADSYFRANFATEYLRKCQDLPTTVDRSCAARDTWTAAEASCYRTNRRLLPYLLNWGLTPEDEPVAVFIAACKKRLARWLGTVPAEKAFAFRHGPGATFGDRGRLTTVPDKMQSRPTMTSTASAFLCVFSRTAWGRCRPVDGGRDPEVVRGNRFTTVPKDATKDRAIAIEPSINVFAQLGIGHVLRNKLHAIGIDLDHGQDKHRLMAEVSSRSGELCTIDLSSASDTVAYNLVKLLLPPEWFELLDLYRSPFTLVDGSWVHLQKFSSMGNGFTFELESLLFTALVATAMELNGLPIRIGENLSVYGDDILCPASVFPAVAAVLRYFGFSLNERKTFSTGLFRESCGGDFFNGIPVRGVYVKKIPSEPAEWISLANQLRPHVVSGYVHPGAWHRAISALPSCIKRIRGPAVLGDIVIHDEPNSWQVRVVNSIRYIRCYRPVGRPIPLSKWEPDVQLASALYGVSSRGPLPRGRISGFRESWVPFS